jgi:hypothetical protein
MGGIVSGLSILVGVTDEVSFDTPEKALASRERCVTAELLLFQLTLDLGPVGELLVSHVGTEACLKPPHPFTHTGMDVRVGGHSAYLFCVGGELAHLLGGGRNGLRAWKHRHDGRT